MPRSTSPTDRKPRPKSAVATQSSPASLEMRIQETYGGLPSSEAKVAEVLLHHPTLLVSHTATELAGVAQVSKAAVTRLIQRLGYASYAAARTQAREAQQWGSPIYLESDAPGEHGLRQGYAAHVAADQQLLARTLETLDESALEGAVTALATARRVVVVGFRNSAWLAMYARSQLGLLRPAVDLSPLPAETLAEGLADFGARDVMLAIGFRRRVPAFEAALQVARAAGARIVLVSDPSGVTELQESDYPLTCHTRGAARFDSYVAGVSVLNFLTEQVAARLGEAARLRLQEVEKWHRQLRDLV